MVDMEQFIKEIALEHGVLLQKHDPALVLASVNEKLLGHYAKQLIADQSGQQIAISRIIESNNEKAKEASSQAITKAGHYIYDQVVIASKQLNELMGKELRTERLVLLRELEQFRSVFQADNVTLRHRFEKTGANVAGQIRTFQWLSFAMTVVLVGLLGIWLGMYLVR